MSIEVCGGLILAMFKYSYIGSEQDEVCIDDKLDKDLFQPDGETVAYISSNYCKIYHPNYINLSKSFIEENKRRTKEHNNNRGRKKKDKVKKNKKKDNGSNDQFGSCVTFGVISDNRVHGVKIFRKNSGNISKLTHADIISETYIPQLLGRLFAYINRYKPVGIDYIGFSIELENITSKYPLPPDKVINLYAFRPKLNLGMYNSKFWDCYYIIYDFNGKYNHLKIKLMETPFSDRTTDIKLTPEGKIHVYGSKDSAQAEKFLKLLFKIIDRHKDDPHILVNGIRAAPKPKPAIDYTQVLYY